MALPVMTDSDKISSYFDCKIRRLFVHIPKQEKAKVIEEEAPESQADDEINLNTDIVEDEVDDDDIEVIDTDDHFGRDKSGKVQKVAKEAPKVVNSNDLDDDLLYDLC